MGGNILLTHAFQAFERMLELIWVIA